VTHDGLYCNLAPRAEGAHAALASTEDAFGSTPPPPPPSITDTSGVSYTSAAG